MKHFSTLKELSKEEILEITDISLSLKKDFKNNKIEKILENKVLGMIFEKSSTRTRVSFESGMFHLGGHSIFLSTNDIQLGRGESIEDTIKVLSRMVDFVMIRTNEHTNIEEFAKHSSVPIINGLSDLFHPTQLIADYMTMVEYNKENGKIAYIGDGNNMANSWAVLASKIGIDISIASPEGYEVKQEIKDYTIALAKENNSQILFTNNPQVAIKDADVVVTDTFLSMGLENEKKIRKQIFAPFCVDQELFNLANNDAIFMHCLPAYRGDEVSSQIIDGKNSVIFDEAENRLHANKGILVWLNNNLDH